MVSSKSLLAAATLLFAQTLAVAPSAYNQPPAHTQARYGGDIVLRFNVTSAEDLSSLNEAVETLLLDVWDRKPAQRQIDIRLPTETVPLLLGLLPESLQEAHEPLLREKDLVDAIINTYPGERDQNFNHRQIFAPPATTLARALRIDSSSESLATPQSEKDLFFSNYQPLSAIEPWMQLLASLYSSHVSLITIGQSFEGRPITGLRIGLQPATHTHPRETILIVSGLHAREWISTSTVTYIAYNLIHKHNSDPRISHLLQHYDFVLLPTLNPDGYEYTWTTDRLWRKTRQTTSTRFCPGIDLDRAFAFEWRELDNTCSEAYPGEQPFAAVEAAVLAAWAKNETESQARRFVGFLDLHSYSETILYPYSYTCAEEPPSLENLEELASGLRRAVSDVHGHRYALMPACEENMFASTSSSNDKVSVGESESPAGGSALDYFYHVLNVRYSYQIKLRDRGSYGFLLPREHIVPTGKEILNAVVFMGEWLWENNDGDDDDDGDDGDDDEDDDFRWDAGFAAGSEQHIFTPEEFLAWQDAQEREFVIVGEQEDEEVSIYIDEGEGIEVSFWDEEAELMDEEEELMRLAVEMTGEPLVIEDRLRHSLRKPEPVVKVYAGDEKTVVTDDEISSDSVGSTRKADLRRRR